MPRSRCFLVMAGGTGGHIYPALATARELMNGGDRVVWLGSCGGMEESIVPQQGIEFRCVDVSGIRGKGLMVKLLAPLRIAKAIYQALVIVKKVSPDAVLGMGGFASGPGGVAAKLLGIPLLVHEQNAVAGLTNRLLSKIAVTVMQAFEGAFSEDEFANGKRRLVLTGNPVRSEICALYYRPGVAKGSLGTAAGQERKVNLLVLGGSLGAQAINESVPAAIAHLETDIRPQVMHQTGKRHLEATQDLYGNHQVEAEVRAYIDDMEEAYRWADLVICRAGALTVSELCVAGLGAVLVPYPYAVDDHQTRNAESMARAGAGWILAQQDLSVETLAEILTPILKKPGRIAQLAEAARKLAQPEATERVANECRKVCYG